MTVSLFLKNLAFTLVIPGSVGFYVPLLLVRGRPARSGIVVPVALMLFGVAISLYFWSVWHFGARGRGTPLPLDAPKKLVIQGPYRYTRNPMYLGLFSALIGWLILFPIAALAVYAVIVAIAVSLFVIGYEEAALHQMFGAEYDAYRSAVPRWLPRFRPRPDP